MKKKVVRSALNAQLAASAVAFKTLTTEQGSLELTLLPVLPASPFSTTEGDGRSGISFVYDAEGLADRYNGGGRKANLNIEHNRSGGDTRSRGYCYELTTAEREPEQGMQPGLLYGWFVMSALGADEMTQRLWLYTSAEIRGMWLDETTYQITKFTGHALTNNPATEMPANFSEQSDEADEADEGEDLSASAASGYTEEQLAEQAMLKAILEQLGLPADATEEQVLSCLTALRTPAVSETEQALTAAGFTAADLTAGALVRSEQLTAVQAEVQTLTAQVGTLTADLATATTELTAARAEIQTLKSADTERQVFAAVDAAIAARKATPASRDALVRLAKADLTAFSEAMAAAPEVLGTAPIQTPGNAAAVVALTAEEKAFCKAYGFKESSYLRAKQQGALN